MVTTYFLNLIAGNVMHSNSSAALPTSYYVALSTSIPSTSGTGFSEVSGNGYSRQIINSVSEPSEGTVNNSSEVSYPEATGSWGTIQAFGLYDAAKDGNLLVWNTLQTPQTVVSGNQVRFKPGALKLSFKAE